MVVFLLLFVILFFVYILIPKKYNILASIMMGLLFGFFAYCFIPHSNHDLFRFHQVATNFILNNNFAYLSYSLSHNDLEILPQIYIALISLTGNVNLLQFIVVTAGYSIIFFILKDYKEIVQLKNMYFVPISIFTIFGFYALYFISGLFYYIAIITFALSFYYDYVKNGKKVLVWFLYIFTLFMHNSMFFPFILLVVFKLFKNKINLKLVLVVALLVFFSYNIIVFLISTLNFSFLIPVKDLYFAYLNNGDRMQKLYDGTRYFIEITKLVFTFLTIILTVHCQKIKKINVFIVILAFSTIFMMRNAIVMIRFIMLVQFIGIIPTINYFSINKKNAIMYILLCILALIYFIYFVRIMGTQNFSFIFR